MKTIEFVGSAVVTADEAGNIFVCNATADGELEPLCALVPPADDGRASFRRVEAKFAWIGCAFVVCSAWYIAYLVGLAIWKAVR